MPSEEGGLRDDAFLEGAEELARVEPPVGVPVRPWVAQRAEELVGQEAVAEVFGGVSGLARAPGEEEGDAQGNVELGACPRGAEGPRPAVEGEVEDDELAPRIGGELAEELLEREGALPREGGSWPCRRRRASPAAPRAP